MELNIFEDDILHLDPVLQTLYSEDNGKFKLTAVKDMKTTADIASLQNALAMERNDHKAAKEQIAAYKTFGDTETIAQQLSRIAELEAGAGKPDEDKINAVAAARVNTLVKPLEVERNQLQQQISEYTQVIEGYKVSENRRVIKDSVTEAIGKAKLDPTYAEHVHLLAEKIFTIDDMQRPVTKDNVGCTPFIDPVVWLSEMQAKYPYWWGKSQGGGAPGSNGGMSNADNPFSKTSWNLTKQGELFRENPQRAEQLRQMAARS
jgi:hypothetical protein